MIVDVLARLTQSVQRAVDDGYYRDFAAGRTGGTKAPSLEAAVRRDAPWAFLAEAKPASPSRGDLSGGDAAGKARRMLRIYRDYGATGISVLTERDTFRGSLDLLASATRSGGVPVLMKDFVVHDDQLDAAQAAGASAVLFIHHLFARGKTAWELPDAIAAAHRRGLEVLLEVDNAAAFEHAATTDADLIGINNRDLTTLEMDPDRASDILRHRMHLVPDTPVLALSGIETRADVQATQEGGATGVLVGTTLMEADDPRATLRRLRGLAHVKCCGAGHPGDGTDVVEALGAADAVGCVVRADGAARERTLDEARRLFAGLPPGVERILVTTDPDPVWLDEAVHTSGANGIQVHRELSADEAAAVRKAIGDERTFVALVRVPPMGDDDAAAVQAVVERARTMFAHADRVLLDAAPRSGADAGGGGQVIDWAFARHVVDMLRPSPIVLSGGLTPDNVPVALRRVRPWGVDVSSGIETQAKGRKDPVRVRSFCRSARSVLNLHDPPPDETLRVL